MPDDRILEDTPTVAAILQTWLETRRLSAAELARAANVKPDSMSRFLSGERTPGQETRQRLADALILPAKDRVALYEARR